MQQGREREKEKAHLYRPTKQNSFSETSAVRMGESTEKKQNERWQHARRLKEESNIKKTKNTKKKKIRNTKGKTAEILYQMQISLFLFPSSAFFFSSVDGKHHYLVAMAPFATGGLNEKKKKRREDK